MFNVMFCLLAVQLHIDTYCLPVVENILTAVNASCSLFFFNCRQLVVLTESTAVQLALNVKLENLDFVYEEVRCFHHYGKPEQR